MAVPVVWRERASDAPAFRARSEGARCRDGAQTKAGEPACAAPCLCKSLTAERRRPALRADAARACGYLDHADLHACARRAAEKPCPRPASIGRELKSRLS